ncbi:MAG: phosphatase PAP2 family protein [Verrucomicrobiota bacterium JB022]|nr:phosphatase PAP2 family protein [Verrucomicrobiota bacterium JB022]
MNSWQMLATLWKGIPGVARDHWRMLLMLNLAAILLAVGLSFFDQSLLPALQLGEPSEAYELAGFLSEELNFDRLPLYVCLALWVIGTFQKRRDWKAIALTIIFAACFAGIGVNVFRGTLGRPRPSAEWADVVGTETQKPAWFLFGAPQIPAGAELTDAPPQGFYGPSSTIQFQSLPSGHCATSFAYSTAVCIVAPAYAIPATIAAGAVAWSRLERNRHWPSDVLIGSSFGITCGLLVGIAGRRMMRETKALPPEEFS